LDRTLRETNDYLIELGTKLDALIYRMTPNPNRISGPSLPGSTRFPTPNTMPFPTTWCGGGPSVSPYTGAPAVTGEAPRNTPGNEKPNNETYGS